MTLPPRVNIILPLLLKLSYKVLFKVLAYQRLPAASAKALNNNFTRIILKSST
jgi:hypothetical protein